MAWKSNGDNGNQYERKDQPLLLSPQGENESSGLRRHSSYPNVRKRCPTFIFRGRKGSDLHMDPAPAHVHEKTYKWLNQRRIKYIPKEKWMANSLDMAPMDYCVNSNFKNIWSRKEAKNRVELATIAKW